MVGLRSVKVSEKLQMDLDLMLQSAINSARQNDLVKKNSRRRNMPSEINELKSSQGKDQKQSGMPKRPSRHCETNLENLSCHNCPAKNSTS